MDESKGTGYEEVQVAISIISKIHRNFFKNPHAHVDYFSRFVFSIRFPFLQGFFTVHNLTQRSYDRIIDFPLWVKW
jgi:hypothetical protein